VSETGSGVGGGTGSEAAGATQVRQREAHRGVIDDESGLEGGTEGEPGGITGSEAHERRGGFRRGSERRKDVGDDSGYSETVKESWPEAA